MKFVLICSLRIKQLIADIKSLIAFCAARIFITTVPIARNSWSFVTVQMRRSIKTLAHFTVFYLVEVAGQISELQKCMSDRLFSYVSAPALFLHALTRQ